MIIRLAPEDIVRYWDAIRYGLQQVAIGRETVLDEPNLMKFTNGVLINLLSDKAQAWLILTEDRRPKMIVLTQIVKTIGGQSYIQIDLAYGYLASTAEEKHTLLAGAIYSFAKNVGANFILANSHAPIAWRAMQQAGMTEKSRIFTMAVK